MTFSPLDSLLTGPLFTTAPMRAVFSDASRLRLMLLAEAALARAEEGLVPPGLAEALDAITPDRLDPAAIGRATALAGVPTIPFAKAVGALLPPELEAGFHKAATTQDILDTALALQLRDALDLLRADLLPVLDALSALAELHAATPCAGRTYGQHGAPVTFGFKAAIWLSGVAEVAARLPALRAALPATLSGPVGTLAGLGPRGPEIADRFAAALGLRPAPVAPHARRAWIADLGCWLALLVGALAKVATDVVHLASTEVAELSEPFQPGRGGSSAMPHKRNPVSCTVILAAHAAVPGHAATLLSAMAALHERPPGLWHAEWLSLPTLCGLAAGALHEARTLLAGLEVHPARMRRNLDATDGLLFADAVAARLALTMGRGPAHHLVEQAATEVRATGAHLRAVLSRLRPDAGLDAAFDLSPAAAAAAPWIARARADAARIRRSLLEDPPCP